MKKSIGRTLTCQRNNNDQIIGGDGDDTLTGNNGNDEFTVDAGTDTITDLSDADDVTGVTTEIVNNPAFYFAEEYHQQYLAKNPGGYCNMQNLESTGFPSFV